MNYYNENEPFAAQWLERLCERDLIAPGRVDSRSILGVRHGDLEGVTQAHFFAGIGGWSYALRLAGWPDSSPVWTGSCPCQPFSVAGKRKGFKDERHLWPVWRDLIEECRPPVVFGEQVASPTGRAWLSGVRDEMEALGYAVGAADLCAAGVGAPHVRQRLFFGAVHMAYSEGGRRTQVSQDSERSRNRSPEKGMEQRATRGCPQRRVAYATSEGWDPRRGRPPERGLYDREDARRQEGHDGPFSPNKTWGRTLDAWREQELLPCVDGKARPVEPGTFPLAHGIPKRMGRLRGYGNAIVPQVAAHFIAAFVFAAQDSGLEG